MLTIYAVFVWTGLGRTDLAHTGWEVRRKGIAKPLATAETFEEIFKQATQIQAPGEEVTIPVVTYDREVF